MSAQSFKSIRVLLGLSQAGVATILGCTQGNVSFYERGQTVSPEVAKKLIDHAASIGITLTYDHVYGAAALPAPALEPAKAV